MLVSILLMLQAAPGVSDAPFDTKADYGALVRVHCQREWPDNFVVQEACGKSADRGMAEFRGAYQQFGKSIERALEKCVEDWTTDRIPNWTMIGACAKSQAAAFGRLNRAP